MQNWWAAQTPAHPLSNMGTVPRGATAITHAYVQAALQEGARAIDATCGNGHDTAFLAQLVGETGKVIGFDIQQQAVDNTRKRLEEAGLLQRCELHLCSHAQMEEHVKKPVDAVMFNLGYLPGGDHGLTTQFDSTRRAVQQAMALLRPGGIITVGVYYGMKSGFEEKEQFMEYIKTIDNMKYTVLVHDYVNQPNCPPIAVVIEKRTEK